MGFFSFLSGKNKEPIQPPGAGIGYGEYDTPRGKYPLVPSTGKGTGIDGWAPKLGTTLPDVPHQDALLIHYDLPTPIEPGHPSPFWTNRNANRLARGTAETLQSGPGVAGTDAWSVKSFSNREADDPKRTPVPNFRPTQEMSASNYRFYAPQRSGRGDTPHLNGFHFSMATARRTFPIRGMRPAQRIRNTYRIEPPPRDAQSMDVPAQPATVPAQEYVTPVMAGAPSNGRSYRL